MKKILIIVGIILVILVAGGVLLLKYVSNLPQTQLTAEQRDAGYKRILEKDYPELKNYWQYIPLAFPDGLRWDDVNQANKDNDFRIVKTAKGEEKVSTIEAFRIMYKYPDTEYFAKMHVEQSKKEEFSNDKIKVVDELKFISKSANIDQKNYRGYEYYYIGNSDLNISPIGMALVFFPENQIITTIYFLNQKSSDRKFQTIEEFNSLKDNFINELIDNNQ
jgi:hypothetical protein